MTLTDDQLAQWQRDGFFFIENVLSPDEIERVNSEAQALTGEKRKEIVFEKDGSTLRSIFNMHEYNDLFGRLVRHPKLIEPAMQLLDSQVYVFQIVLNFKAPLRGEWWPWHQDYPTYHNDDGIPAPRMVNVLLFLDEVTEFNGPLMVVPGSHKEDFPLPDVSQKSQSYPGRWLDEEYAGQSAGSHGIVAPKGPAGSVIFAHTNIVHGSGPNMSPWGRSMISLTLNSVENKGTSSRRPGFIVPTTFAPIEPLSADCLARAAA